MKTESESIEATLEQEADPVRGVCGAHGGHETAEVRDVRGLVGSAGSAGGQEKEWMGCLLDDLRVFGIYPSLPGSRLRIFIAMQVQHSYISSTNG